VIGQPTEPDSDGTLVSDVGSQIKVAVDRWSAGQIGLSDLAVAAGIVAVAATAAWLVRRLSVRWTRRLEGPTATAGLVIGQLASAAIYLFAVALVLEVLGFGLGPVVIIVLILAVAVMFLRPLIQNMSSGLLLQLRGPFAPGDLVETSGVTGVVEAVNTRTVVLITGDGRTVHIPSRDVLDHSLVNHSALGRRRSTISFRVDGGADPAPAAASLCDALANVEEILTDPPPEVVVTGFDGSHTCMDMLIWHEPELPSGRAARDAASRALITAFDGLELNLADPTVHVTRTATTPLPKASD